MPSQRKNLYNSAIQHVLVLAQEDAAEVAAQERAEAEAAATKSTQAEQAPPAATDATPKSGRERSLNPWRLNNPMKTAHFVLMICLNIGVDPPDSRKPYPCAKLECWTEPTQENPASLRTIVSRLRVQYGQWQPPPAKPRFKIAEDPLAKDMRNACASMRKGAKQDRVLFHYNGHGVPDPTGQGEIWVFNISYTQYIPFSLGELHEHLGNPAILVFDCNSAGRVLYNYKLLLERVEGPYRNDKHNRFDARPLSSHRDTIILAACSDGERLPVSAKLPADLFTCCLTTPIKTVLHWFVEHTLVAGITDDMVDKVPGTLHDRLSPLGELNWIFAAVTDAIAWNVLPREEFLTLYRQDMLLASLLRNYLLAERVLRSYRCHPVCLPELPETHDHSLWKAFDVAVEKLFSQLPRLIAEEEAKAAQLAGTEAVATAADTVHANGHPPASLVSARDVGSAATSSAKKMSPAAVSKRPMNPFATDLRTSCFLDGSQSSYDGSYEPSTFFEEQLKAFDVWLDMGPEQRGPPEQLPIMLQVLLSGELREIALPLLSRYVQTGPVAVDYFLSVGIFPYVVQLTQIETGHQVQELIFIWSKILALDISCSDDLIEIDGERFFVDFLKRDDNGEERKPVYLAVAMFVLSVVSKKHPERCQAMGTTDACFTYLSHANRTVRRWACLCIMTVLRYGPIPTQSRALANGALLEKVHECATNDCAPDVRASATALLSVLMGEILLQQSPHDCDDSGSSSQCSTSEYLPNRPKADMTSLLGSETPSAVELRPTDIDNVSDGTRIKTAAMIVMENDMHTPLVEEEFLDAPVSPYSADERDALLFLGTRIADIGRRDSSVVVRRESSIAIARAVHLHRDRFIRAAYITDVIGIDEAKEAVPQSDIDRCEAAYRRLWLTLSELACDPHPIVAALARRSYDLISELLLDRAGPVRGARSRSPSFDEIPPTDHVFSPPTSTTSNFLTSEPASRGGRSSFEPSSSTGVGGSSAGSLSKRSPFASPKTGPGREHSARREVQSPSKQAICRESSIPPLAGGFRGRPTSSPMSRTGLQRAKRLSQNPPFDVPSSSVHVRSTSGSFDLNASLRIPLMSTMPRVNSASLIAPMAKASARRGLSAAASSQDLSATRLERIVSEAEERPRSFPRIAVGVEMLFKTVSEQLNRTGLDPPSAVLPRSIGSNSSSGGGREEGKDAMSKPQSPPRLPRRNLSYQVLNAATALSSSGEIPISASIRPSYFASAKHEESGDNLSKLVKIPEGYDRLYLSQDGDAALSLLEWSSASVARLEFDARRNDTIHQKESVPRYAALWDKFLKSSGKIPSETLKAFALLGEGQNCMGAGSCGPGDADGRAYKFSEISSHAMTNKGGAVAALAFLPRDVGMGEDQLIATGDSDGFVGIYDIHSGTCHASMAVPFPPGMPRVGISALLCLNRPSPATIGRDSSFGNSRSALILAGAYDGRVAIFKSEPQGPKYRVMSTFQSSGQSYWSKVGTVRGPTQEPRQHDVMLGTYHSSDSIKSLESCDFTFTDTVKDSGNGLILAFDSESSYLAAGGCDAENVRVWDLAREYCIWEGAGVAEGTWPTAVTMWGRINPKVFVTGSSNGTINIVDMRDRPMFAKPSLKLTILGQLTDPIISLGTCPPVGGFPAETVVSADIGGEIAFWDARLTRNSSVPLTMERTPGLSHLKAHRSNLTSMAVHPAGTLLASGSTAKCVKIFGPNRAMLKMMSAHDQEARHDLAGDDHLIPPVTSLCFQPESNMLAIGSLESTVLVYGQPDLFPGVHSSEDQIFRAKRAALYEYGRDV